MFLMAASTASLQLLDGNPFTTLLHSIHNLCYIHTKVSSWECLYEAKKKHLGYVKPELLNYGFKRIAKRICI